MMTIDSLEKELKNGNLNCLYLLYGEELFLLETSLKRIKTLFGEIIKGINYILIDEGNLQELISDIETPAFGYDKKLIIVKNAGLFKKDKKGMPKGKSDLSNKIAKYIEENAKQLEETIVLIFIEEDITKNDLLKAIEKNGEVCNFEKLKPIEIKKRIKNICNMYEVEIDDKTLQTFIETCGTNMQVLINEIRKLIEYAGKGGKITEEAIEKLATKEFDSVIFDLTDNLGKRNIREALEILKELIYNKEPVQKILITLYNHFRKIYLTKLALEYREDVLETLKLKPNQTFLVSKYKKQAQYFKTNELRNILGELIELDKNYKIGLIDINVGLESILCTYF